MELIDKLKAWFSGRRKLSVLLLCDDNISHANMVIDHIVAFVNLSKHKIDVFNPRELTESTALHIDEFDVVIIHYSLVIISDYYLPPSLREQIRSFQGLKVQFIQDDYRWVDDIAAMMRHLGIHVVFTLFPEAQIPKVWTDTRLPGVRKISTLAGYIPDRLVGITTPPVESRPIDIGYRGRALPYWLGQFGQEKVWIAQGVLQHADKYGLCCDIAWREADRIYGQDWDNFMCSCKATLGTESGASITDFDSSLEQRTQAYLREHPTADFWEVHRAILAPYEGNAPINVISSKIFEAIALRTALILFPGDYSGIVQPWYHYIPLEKDFSNMDVVAEKLRDGEFLRAMTERAYEDIVASGQYAYWAFIKEFDKIITDEVVSLALSRLLSKVNARLSLLDHNPVKNDSLEATKQQENATYLDFLRSKTKEKLIGLTRKKPLNILILYDNKFIYSNAIMDHLKSFAIYSCNNIFYAIATDEAVCTTNLSLFDTIIIHPSIRLSCLAKLSSSYEESIKKFHGLKILFVQNEYDTTENVRQRIESLGIHVVFTCVPAEHLEAVYPSSRFPHVEFVPTLTAYVPSHLEDYTTPKPLSERTFVIGYRGQILPYWYGKLGREQLAISQKMRQFCEERGLCVDIAWEQDKHIYGERWYKFLEDCQATLGTESGSSIFDYYGDIKTRIEIAIQQKPSATYDEIYNEYLAKHEGNIVMNQISPHIFESISLKTSLILFEGNYAGIIKPYLHYIPLKKDFSNIDEVFGLLEDQSYLQKLAERSYLDIVKLGKYSYKKFINNIDSFIEQRMARGYDIPLVSGLLGSQHPSASNLHLQGFYNTYSLRSIPTTMPLLAHHIHDLCPPVADAGPPQMVGVGETVMLDASCSSSAEGAPLTFHWSLLATPVGSTAVLSDATAVGPTFVADQPGAYVGKLVVADGPLKSPPAFIVVTTQPALGPEHVCMVQTRALVKVKEVLSKLKRTAAAKLSHYPLLFHVFRGFFRLVRASLSCIAYVLWQHNHKFLRRF